MGIQILNKDVSVISSVMGKLKASIGSIFGTTGWAGGGGGGASQGPLAGTPPATVDTSVGSVSWSNLANLFSATLDSSTNLPYFSLPQRSYYIVGQGFGFSIPTGATINGIVVTLQVRNYDAQGAGNAARDYIIKIVKNNTITGTDKSTLAPITPDATFVNRTYGSSTDLWGETWTAADINNSNFGVAYSAELNVVAKNYISVSARNLRITVHYTT
jgi:hypothetical protein